MATKTKSGLFQTPASKPSPTTPRGKSGSSASVKSDADSPSTNSRFSFDRASSKPVTSRPVSRSSPRISAPDKSQPRINKPSELQTQLQAAQDDSKKAKEKLVLSEKEKSQALSDLNKTKKLADEANEKLQQALVAQKLAEESSEIEKFRAVELEQAGIAAIQKKDEEWKKELESQKTSFLTATEELEKVKQELGMVIDTKNQALAHADDATKIAESQTEKVELLSAELARVKGLLEAKTENEQPLENGLVVELDSVRKELEKAKGFELELLEKGKSYEKKVVNLQFEMESLREELDKANACKKELVEKEKIVEDMRVELASREQELEKAKSCERDLIEKGKIDEKTLRGLIAEMNVMEQNLLMAKTSEQDFIGKEKSYEKTISELEINLVSVRQDLEKTKSSEQDLVEKEKSKDIIVTELKLEIGSIKLELEKAKELEEKLVGKEFFYEETILGLKSETEYLNEELDKAKILEEELIKKEKLNEKIVMDFESELNSLKQELRVSKSFQEKLKYMEESYEQMNVELEAARMAESYALNSLNEWKNRAEDLELKVAETMRLEKSRSESLESIMKQLEGNSDELHEAECEVAALREKVSLLEISLRNRKEDLEESENLLRKANEEVKGTAALIESLRSELEAVKEEKAHALENEKLAAENVQDLLEEKNNIINDLEILKKEEEKSKMAMESLANALHEVSVEARDAKERLLSSQEEHENFENQIEHLQLVVKATTEKYEVLLEDSKQEIDHLTNTVEQSKIDFDIQMEDLKVVLKASNEKYETMLDEAKEEIDHLKTTLEKSELEHDKKQAEWEGKEIELLNCVGKLEEKEMMIIAQSELSHQESKAEWEQKEVQLVNGLKRSEEEKSSMEKEIMRLASLLREAEENFRGTENEASYLKGALEDVESNCLKLNDNLHGAKNELQNVKRENEQLRALEDANVCKINELTKLLEEAKTQVHHQSTENGELSDSDKDYDLLPKVVGFSEENGHFGDLKPQQKEGLEEELPARIRKGVVYPEEVNGTSMTPENKEQVKEESVDSEAKMWESYKVDREFSAEMETEQGSLDDEVESRADITESPSEKGSSDSKQQKKNKPLYRKFGNLLKKGISNPK